MRAAVVTLAALVGAAVAAPTARPLNATTLLGYSPSAALRSVYLSGAAYCAQSQLSSWSVVCPCAGPAGRGVRCGLWWRLQGGGGLSCGSLLSWC